MPTNVVVRRNCSQNVLEVAWQASRGAINYTAAAVAKGGSRLECVSNNTSCRIDSLMCSQVYSVTVAAVDNSCTSTVTPMVKRPTGK